MNALLVRHVFKVSRTSLAVGLVAVLVVSATAAFIAGGASVHPAAPAIEFRLPNSQDIPAAIALAPDGSVWFTLESSDSVGVLRDGQIHKLVRGGETLEALGIAVDDNGAWLTDAAGKSIAHIDNAGTRDSISIPGPLAQLGRLALAPDGAVWFADSWSNSVTRLQEHHLEPHSAAESNAAPFGVAVARDGTVWSALQIANKLVRIAPDGVQTEFEVSTRNSTPTDVALDASGGVWFTELRGNKIGHFADGHFSEFAVPYDAPGLTSLAVAPDGSVWFTELRRHCLARLRNGALVEFTLDRPDARPFSIAVSATGDVWYADLSGWIGKLPAERAQADRLNLGSLLGWLGG
jgi:virginiamycin B lyase